MNVLVIGSYPPRVGGVPEVIRQLYEGIVKNGHKCSVITYPLSPSSKSVIKRNINGVDVYYVDSLIPIDYSKGFMVSRNFYKLLSEKVMEADIVHIHMFHTFLSLQALFHILHIDTYIPIVFTPHYHGKAHSKTTGVGFPLLRILWKYILSRREISSRLHFVFVSHFEARQFIEDFPFSSEFTTKVIPNGVDINMELPRKHYPKELSDSRLLYVGRLERYKGVQYILKSLSILCDLYGKAPTLTIVGKGPYERELKELARNLGISENVVFIPYVSRDKLLEFYRTHDIFLLLSKAEAYGLVVAEALASGIPCIVTNSQALSEFKHEKGCFVVKWPPDPNTIAKLIVKILQTKLVIGPFSKKIMLWDKVTKEYLELFSSLLI